ncbi:clusterin [Puma concolor]|uniref:Clusterin n=1 Tax=Puma concolor TaxID=9696 RepID=A0A6P6HQF5_PUMCO|nr:clusterin [Puma concolor]
MKTLLLLVGLLLTCENGRVLGDKAVSDAELQEMSTEGSKYINKEIKNALKGVKQIKTLIEQTNEERKSLLSNLEEAKKKKELEEFLNQSSPFYFWINGDRIDSLLENDRQQTHAMDVMQDSFNRASRIMDELFQDRFFTREPQDTYHYSPFSSLQRRPFFFNPKSRFARNVMPFPAFQPLNFHDMFQPFFDMIHQAQQAMDINLQRIPYHFPMEFTEEDNQDRMVCKEIRHNSTGCLRMKDQCDKCQEILSVDCSASNPSQVLLRQELNNSLQMAEKFTKLYDELLRSYQEKMFNTSSLLKQLNEQFSWVSQLANLTQSEDPFYLQVTTVSSQTSDSNVPSGFTKVVVKLFDSDPISVMVPEEVSRNNPKFMETVAEKALQEYRQKNG